MRLSLRLGHGSTTSLANDNILLSVECLIVIDRSAYSLFQNLYGNIDQSLLKLYKKLLLTSY
jgi:hypothetical protein